MAMKRAAAWGALAVLSITVHATAQPAKPAAQAEKRAHAVQRSIGKTFVRDGKSRAQYFSFDFPTWQPNNLHWTAPSTMYISTNGDWFFYAEALENQQGTYVGSRYSFDLTISYFRDYNATTKTCSGPVFHRIKYVAVKLNWKQKAVQYSTRGNDKDVLGLVGLATCANALQEINPA